MKKIKKVCSKCKSDDIVVDAWARWNSDLDRFELDNVFDYTYCNNCDGETNDEDVEIIE